MEYHLKITLNDFTPNIERVVMIDSNWTFLDLHYLIMAVTQFEALHSFNFTFSTANADRNIEIVPKQDDIAEWLICYDEVIEIFHEANQTIDCDVPEFMIAEKTPLHEIFTLNKNATYRYDFSNNWEFNVSLIETVPTKLEVMPTCLSAVGVAPPEDCNGVDGYKQFLETLASTSKSVSVTHHKSTSKSKQIKWSNSFDLTEINKRVNKLFNISKPKKQH